MKQKKEVLDGRMVDEEEDEGEEIKGSNSPVSDSRSPDVIILVLL